jgi:hypothetical protein
MLGVGGDLQEGFGRGAKEHAVDDLLVLKGHGRERLRQREDDMKVLSRQQLSGALLEPRGASSALALRTMAIAARTIRDRLIITSVTLLGVGAERSGAVRQAAMSLNAFLCRPESESPNALK